MKTPKDYLDDLKAKYGSDYETAKKLETRQTTISSIRKRDAMSDEVAIKVANLLGIEEDEVLISAAIARNEGPAKLAWINHAKKIGIAASLAFFAVSNGKESNANTLRPGLPDLESVYYVK